MLGRTHYKIGVAVYIAAVCAIPQLQATPTAAGIAVAAIGALIPDADHPNAIIYKHIPIKKLAPSHIHTIVILSVAAALCMWNLTTIHDLWLYGVALALLPIPFMPHRTYTYSLEGAAALCLSVWYAINLLGYQQLGVAFVAFDVHRQRWRQPL